MCAIAIFPQIQLIKFYSSSPLQEARHTSTCDKEELQSASPCDRLIVTDHNTGFSNISDLLQSKTKQIHKNARHIYELRYIPVK